jgi:hypothetical protein
MVEVPLRLGCVTTERGYHGPPNKKIEKFKEPGHFGRAGDGPFRIPNRAVAGIFPESWRSVPIMKYLAKHTLAGRFLTCLWRSTKLDFDSTISGKGSI